MRANPAFVRNSCAACHPCCKTKGDCHQLMTSSSIETIAAEHGARFAREDAWKNAVNGSLTNKSERLPPENGEVNTRVSHQIKEPELKLETAPQHPTDKEERLADLEEDRDKWHRHATVPWEDQRHKRRWFRNR
ncbi:MAG: hypothetical protein AAF982_08490 [Pseudomonadota bacterium]